MYDRNTYRILISEYQSAARQLVIIQTNSFQKDSNTQYHYDKPETGLSKNERMILSSNCEEKRRVAGVKVKNRQNKMSDIGLPKSVIPK